MTIQMDFKVSPSGFADLIDFIKGLPPYVGAARIPAAVVRELLDKEGKTQSYLVAEISEYGRTVRFEGDVAHVERVVPGSVRLMHGLWERKQDL